MAVSSLCHNVYRTQFVSSQEALKRNKNPFHFAHSLSVAFVSARHTILCWTLPSDKKAHSGSISTNQKQETQNRDSFLEINWKIHFSSMTSFMISSSIGGNCDIDLMVKPVISENRNSGDAQPVITLLTSKMSSTEGPVQVVPDGHPRPARRSSMASHPGRQHTQEEIDNRIQRRRRASLTFAMEATQVIEIPRYERKLKHVLFYSEAELNLMQCEANMLNVGMDPQEFDWRSFR
jgi:hypothetical protein